MSDSMREVSNKASFTEGPGLYFGCGKHKVTEKTSHFRECPYCKGYENAVPMPILDGLGHHNNSYTQNQPNQIDPEALNKLIAEGQRNQQSYPAGGSSPSMQAFDSGATRSDDTGKIDPEGFFSPLVMTAYSEYMQEHRVQDDGKVRASDNWQRGMPFHKYMKSLYRHFMQLWLLHRGHTPENTKFLMEKRAGKEVPVTVISALSGILFNTMGYFHEYLMDYQAWFNRIVSEPEDADVVRAPATRKRKVQLPMVNIPTIFGPTTGMRGGPYASQSGAVKKC